MTSALLDIKGLTVAYVRDGQPLTVVRDLSLSVAPGETYGLVGESGCGKTTVAFATMRYLPRNGRIVDGSIFLDGEDVLALTDRELREWRGKKAAMVYQDPASALNPTLKVGDQVAEVYRYRRGVSKNGAAVAVHEALRRVALPDPDRIARRYPHELSGGQQQRVVIAMALAANPRMLILDEPTTGLDATVEAEVLDLVAKLREELDAAILLISHNLGLVARMCERVGILYAGRLVEEGTASNVLHRPRHPYTHALVQCVPRLGASRRTSAIVPIAGSLPPLGDVSPGCAFVSRCPVSDDRCVAVEPDLDLAEGGNFVRCHYPERVDGLRTRDGVSSHREAKGPIEQPDSASPTTPALRVESLSKRFGPIAACDDVSITVAAGEILGLVGESGSGKTTLARCLAGLTAPDSGSIELNGTQLKNRVQRRSMNARRALQMVFQNPDSTLNPSHTIRRTLSRAIFKLRGTRRVEELASEVRLEPDRHLDVRAGELSGGLKQRVAIGRAFAGTPTLVICDEPVSSLDVSVQAGILNLLGRLADEVHVAYLFISHDLAVVRYLADRIAVMYRGQVVEIGTAEEVFNGPQHPYTEVLLSAIRPLNRDEPLERIRLSESHGVDTGAVVGCRFSGRCPRDLGGLCEQEEPPWLEATPGHEIRCHIPPSELSELQRSVIGGVDKGDSTNPSRA